MGECECYQTFNRTSTPKGSYHAKTGDNDCNVNSSRYRLCTALCESIRYQAKSEQNVGQALIPRVRHGEAALCTLNKCVGRCHVSKSITQSTAIAIWVSPSTAPFCYTFSTFLTCSFIKVPCNIVSSHPVAITENNRKTINLTKTLLVTKFTIKTSDAFC